MNYPRLAIAAVAGTVRACLRVVGGVNAALDLELSALQRGVSPLRTHTHPLGVRALFSTQTRRPEGRTTPGVRLL